jgi:hypothetical protein
MPFPKNQLYIQFDKKLKINKTKEMKRNETKRNETKRNETKRNKTKRKEKKRKFPTIVIMITTTTVSKGRE